MSLSLLLIELHTMKPCCALEVHLYAFSLQNAAFSEFFLRLYSYMSLYKQQGLFIALFSIRIFVFRSYIV